MVGFRQVGRTLSNKLRKTTSTLYSSETDLDEETFKKDFEVLVDNSMKGSTVVNPIPVSREDMVKFVDAVYYGKKIDF